MSCIFTDDNADQLVLRIRLIDEDTKLGDEEEVTDKAEDESFLRLCEYNLLTSVTLKGVDQISKVYMYSPNEDSKKRTIITPEGEFKKITEWILETDGTNLLRVRNVFLFCVLIMTVYVFKVIERAVSGPSTYILE